MNYTSAQAAKMLAKLQDDCLRLKTQEENSKTFLASIAEDAESVRPEYSYETTKALLSELDTKIRKVKHAINVFNATTVIPEFDMTIDEMLVYIPQLSREKAKLSEMANTPPKARSRTYESAHTIDYKYINYDLAAVKADLDAVSEELSNAQLALDLINHTALINIEI